MNMKMRNYCHSLELHYEKILNAEYSSARDFLLRNKRGVITTYKWTDKCDWGVYVTTTATNCGFINVSKRRVEFYLGINKDIYETSDLLTGLTAELLDVETLPAAGETFDNIAPLWSSTAMTALLLAQVGSIQFPSIIVDGVCVSFLKVIPIYRSELVYKKAFGHHDLLEKMRTSETEYWNINRKPCV
jgi:hypothetical protein